MENMAGMDICLTTRWAGAPSVTLKKIDSLRNPRKKGSIDLKTSQNVSKYLKNESSILLNL